MATPISPGCGVTRMGTGWPPCGARRVIRRPTTTRWHARPSQLAPGPVVDGLAGEIPRRDRRARDPRPARGLGLVTGHRPRARPRDSAGIRRSAVAILRRIRCTPGRHATSSESNAFVRLPFAGFCAEPTLRSPRPGSGCHLRVSTVAVRADPHVPQIGASGEPLARPGRSANRASLVSRLALFSGVAVGETAIMVGDRPLRRDGEGVRVHQGRVCALRARGIEGARSARHTGVAHRSLPEPRASSPRNLA